MRELLQQEYKRLTGQDSTTLEGPLSEDALANLKLYKYSSVDKSFTSRYVLKHYVCLPFVLSYRDKVHPEQSTKWLGTMDTRIHPSLHHAGRSSNH